MGMHLERQIADDTTSGLMQKIEHNYAVFLQWGYIFSPNFCLEMGLKCVWKEVGVLESKWHVPTHLILDQRQKISSGRLEINTSVLDGCLSN